MSVVLLVEYTTGHTRSVPVATESVFQNSWLPVCKSLNLSWVQLFQSGLPLMKDDLPLVLTELVRFETWVRSNTSDTELADRALSLSKALSDVDFSTVTSVYIG